MYKLTDCSLSQALGRQHDFKEVSLESRRKNYQNESRKFEHSLVWRLVLFSLRITYVSLCKKQHIFVHAISKVMARGVHSNKLEGSWRSGIIYPKTKIPYHYYNLLPLSLSLSLSSLLLLFVADTRRVSPLYFHLYKFHAPATQAVFEFLRVLHSLAERYRSVVINIRFGEKWAFFQSSGNIAFG